MTPLLRTPVCDLLGCRYPIIQTAMGWVADARLVAATSNAGGFGFLACATIAADQLESQIREVMRLTDRPFGLNFHMFQPNASQVVELAIRYRVRAASYGRGPDKSVIGRLRDGGVLCMPTVGLAKHAVKAVEYGADLVTVQGGEGGGHTGSTPISILLPQVLDAVKVPIVAAGGYSCGRGLASALAAGAAGIAMGTRFLMTRDSSVPPRTLSRYLAVSDPAQIRVSRAIDGLPQRLIENNVLLRIERSSALQRIMFTLQSAARWKKSSGSTVSDSLSALVRSLKSGRASGEPLIQSLMMANAPMLIQSSMVAGEPEHGVLPAGQVAAAIDELKSCSEVIEEIVEEATECLSRLFQNLQSDVLRGAA
ncbi:NAD(P)H-dependent flavin oxidoreductase YrpB (nitropropane dioxygenase family) [Paraburkholderia sp. BL18I3N2]|uniref:NAD(P)H-dependent flavin oxidoreductase n=1 Tax=Paraburkholderia sp. BL18I3N2 TaxID=1938799 RepID=UPI000D06C8DE|nr:nitronate monooxygenase [Paraburkholderia sp. BL18I3N2]PRX27361.1 NAD(P)H-dependent flavin oxidoreductase YrpB (nitropropane dioxygenase family) [Paraburkholderia sp. BL18I3N2]